MSYKVEVAYNFKKEAKRLIKKYRSLKAEITQLIEELETDPTKGTPLGNGVYKIRLAVASKGKGSSGGVRVLSLVTVTKSNVLLFSIYNKGERDTLADNEIKKLLKDLK